MFQNQCFASHAQATAPVDEPALGELGLRQRVAPIDAGLPFDKAFARDLVAGVSYEDALTQHVTGTGRVRRAACIQTLQAIAMLDLATLQPLLAWARQQEF